MPWADFKPFANYFVPVFFRALGIVAFLPLGLDMSGLMKKFTLACGLSLYVMNASHQLATLEWQALPLEFLIGLVIAFPALMLVEAGGMFGELFEVGRGQNIAQLYDPLSFTQSAIMAQFGRYFVIATIVAAGLLERTLFAFEKTLQIIPPTTFASTGLQRLAMDLISLEANYICGMFQSFLPIALTFWVVDVSMGLIGKALPQVGLQSESFQIKSLLGFLSLLGLLSFQLSPSLWALACPRLELFR